MRENKEQTYTCSECGAVVNEENLHTFGEHMLCDECLERLTVTCDNCGRSGFGGQMPSATAILHCVHIAMSITTQAARRCGRLIECDSANLLRER